MARPRKESIRRLAVPVNLDIEALAADHPPSFTGKSQFFVRRSYEVVSTLIWLERRHGAKEDGFTPIPATYLKKIFSDYAPYLRWLQSAGVVEIDAKYFSRANGKGRCRRYRISARYQLAKVVDRYQPEEPVGDGIAGRIQGPALRLHLTRSEEGTKTRSAISLDSLYSLPFPLLPPSYNVAETAPPLGPSKAVTLGRLLSDLITAAAGAESSVPGSGQAWESGYEFDRTLAVTLSSTTGRLYTPVTDMKRQDRRFLTLNGNELTAIDVRTCHPYLLGFVASRALELEPHLIAKSEIDEWLDLVVGQDLYELLQRAHYEVFGVFQSREVVKQNVQRILNGSARHGDTRLVLASLFPGILSVIDHLTARNGPRFLGCLLQKLEAEIILWRVCPRLHELNVSVLTVHDAVLVPSAAAAEAVRIIKNEFLSVVGCAPELKISSLKDGSRSPPPGNLVADLHAEFAHGWSDPFR